LKDQKVAEMKEKEEVIEEMIKKLEDDNKLINGELNNYISKEDKKLIQENKKELDCLKEKKDTNSIKIEIKKVNSRV
jgi:hypothetical protein